MDMTNTEIREGLALGTLVAVDADQLHRLRQRADDARERIHSLTMQLQDELIYHQQAQREISDLREELARLGRSAK